ncbi:hypothetical protein QBC44DRAFT_288816 [Cladorrhinum sp. PSN332]|nr:hypothetical protein QBC44DRAFT_288816 [Cladorrhinum sp. PSN332]
MAGPGLHQLYPPEGSSIATSFDIVAIHGLGGDAFQTWTYHDTDGRKIMNGGPDPMWIQDFLKKDFPHARIFTYGYTTGDSFFSNIVSGIGDYARDLMARLQGERFDVEKPGERPILFICHSLGGIVLKQALISAHDRSNRHEWILDVPKAVIFMGTPHRGAPIAAYLKFAGKRLPGFPRDWVTVLEPRSKPLEEMMDRFVQMGSKLVDIVSFYETETPWWLDKAVHAPYPLPELPKLTDLNTQVVERASTMLYQENETPLMLSGDHKQICRYSSEADPNYKLVKIQIRRIVTIVFKLAPPVITAIPPPQPPPTTTSNSISRALTWPSRESICRHAPILR